MIKGKSPFPFETIALAVSFSPGLPSLIAEMKRLREIHQSVSVFIHVGKKTSEKHRELSQYLSVNGFHDGNSRIYWEQGEIITNILRICKHEVVDLLLISASEKENFEIPAGQIARGILNKAKCSVLLYTSIPGKEGFKKIVVNGTDHRKTESTIKTAFYFTQMENGNELLVAENSNGNAATNGYSEVLNPEVLLGSENLIKELSHPKIVVNQVSLSDYNSLADFSFKNNADLIVTHSTDHRLMIFDRITQEDGIEKMIQNLPCNLLVVHSRIPE